MPSMATRESARIIAWIARKMTTISVNRLVIERCDRSFAARRGPPSKERDITERAHDAGEPQAGAGASLPPGKMVANPNQ